MHFPGAETCWFHDWQLKRWLDRHRESAAAGNLTRGCWPPTNRRAAAARSRRDADEFWHWSKVAAEVARICPAAEMDIEKLKSLVDREIGKR